MMTFDEIIDDIEYLLYNDDIDVYNGLYCLRDKIIKHKKENKDE